MLVQYVGKSGTGNKTVSRHTRPKNMRKCYLELKGHLRTESYEETKTSKANYIIQSVHYDGNRKFTLQYYHNLVSKAFVQLEEVGPVYTLKEDPKINSFENGLKETTDINFSIRSKSKWKKLPSNQNTFKHAITPCWHLIGDLKLSSSAWI